MGHVNGVTDGIATASQETSAGNRDLSQRTEHAAGQLPQTASTMEELTGTVQQTAGSASTANQPATEARASATKGGSVVSNVTTTMGAIDEASARIAEIVGVMGEIVGSVCRVSEIIGHIAAAAEEQSQGLGQGNGAVAQLDHMTQQNASLVEESTAATESLKGQAASLTESMRQFRL